MPSRSALPQSPKLVVFDFDGVFTDNRVLVHEDGTESVLCNRSDGLGIERLADKGIPMLILSTETNKVVSARARKLGIPCRQGIDNKLRTLKSILKKRRIDPKEVVFVGNDVNDLECLQWVGCGIAVRDSVPAVLSKAKIVLRKEGGKGAVREVCDLLAGKR